MSKFQAAESFQPETGDWQLLPFRFHRLDSKVLLTNMVGEHVFVSAQDFQEVAEDRLPADSALVRRLRAKQIIKQKGDKAPLDLLGAEDQDALSTAAAVHGSAHLRRFSALRALLPVLPGLAAERR